MYHDKKLLFNEDGVLELHTVQDIVSFGLTEATFSIKLKTLKGCVSAFQNINYYLTEDNLSFHNLQCILFSLFDGV